MCGLVQQEPGDHQIRVNATTVCSAVGRRGAVADRCCRKPAQTRQGAGHGCGRRCGSFFLSEAGAGAGTGVPAGRVDPIAQVGPDGIGRVRLGLGCLFPPSYLLEVVRSVHVCCVLGGGLLVLLGRIGARSARTPDRGLPTPVVRTHACTHPRSFYLSTVYLLSIHLSMPSAFLLKLGEFTRFT